MLEFKQDDTSADLILTLNELVTIDSPYFLFAFAHATTKDVVAFVLYSGADESEYPDRYNLFTINPSTLFSGKNPGEWHYGIYEQESDTNLDPAQATALEYGKLNLNRAVDFAYTEYDSATSYKAYDG